MTRPVNNPIDLARSRQPAAKAGSPARMKAACERSLCSAAAVWRDADGALRMSAAPVPGPPNERDLLPPEAL